jgi:hypothetical protein
MARTGTLACIMFSGRSTRSHVIPHDLNRHATHQRDILVPTRTGQVQKGEQNIASVRLPPGKRPPRRMGKGGQGAVSLRLIQLLHPLLLPRCKHHAHRCGAGVGVPASGVRSGQGQAHDQARERWQAQATEMLLPETGEQGTHKPFLTRTSPGSRGRHRRCYCMCVAHGSVCTDCKQQASTVIDRCVLTCGGVNRIQHRAAGIPGKQSGKTCGCVSVCAISMCDDIPCHRQECGGLWWRLSAVVACSLLPTENECCKLHSLHSGGAA